MDQDIDHRLLLVYYKYIGRWKKEAAAFGKYSFVCYKSTVLSAFEIKVMIKHIIHSPCTKKSTMSLCHLDSQWIMVT